MLTHIPPPTSEQHTLCLPLHLTSCMCIAGWFFYTPFAYFPFAIGHVIVPTPPLEDTGKNSESASISGGKAPEKGEFRLHLVYFD
jgi:hypothetical protein